MIVWILSVLILMSILIDTLRMGISPMPTSTKCRHLLQQILPDFTQSKIYDLGSGWGGVLCLLEKKYPKSSIVGIEGAWIPAVISKLFVFLSRKKRVRIHIKNMFSHSLKDADLVYCYLYPKAMTKLSAKLRNELSEGTFVISSVFALPGWEPLKVYNCNDLYRSHIYVYQA